MGTINVCVCILHAWNNVLEVYEQSPFSVGVYGRAKRTLLIWLVDMISGWVIRKIG